MIWVPMLAGDNPAAARRACGAMADDRLRHFYDGHLKLGRAMAGLMGGLGAVAWDAYFFYGPGAVWASHPPSTSAWVHQLTGSAWASAEHRRSGADLQTAIEDILRSLTPPGGR